MAADDHGAESPGRETAKKRGRVYRAMADRNDALNVVREAAEVCIFFAVLQGILGVLSNHMLLGGAALLLIGAILLLWLKSRVVALIVLAYSSATVAMILLGVLDIAAGARVDGLLALIVVGSAVRATQATFKLQGKYRDDATISPAGADADAGSTATLPPTRTIARRFDPAPSDLSVGRPVEPTADHPWAAPQAPEPPQAPSAPAV